MTSKNSFLIDLREDIKRRLWVILVVFCSLLTFYPIVLLLLLSSAGNRFKPSDPLYMSEIERICSNTLHFNEAGAVIIFILGIVAGLQAVAFLNDRVKVDFYNSQPVSKTRRFVVTETGGLIIFAVSYIINSLLGNIIALTYRPMPKGEIAYMAEAFGMYLLLYLSAYNLGVLATALTGHLYVSILVCGVLTLYEVAARGVFYIIFEEFFATFSYRAGEAFFKMKTVPLYYGLSYINAVNSRDVAVYAVSLIVLMIVLIGLAYISFTKRPCEIIGKGLSYRWLQLPMKLLLLLVLCCFGGVSFAEIAGGGSMIMVLGVLFLGLVGHLIIQIVYECDIRGIAKGIKSSIAGIAIAMVVMVFLRNDFIGYDRYLPQKEELAAVSISLNPEGYMNVYYKEQEGKMINSDTLQVELTELDKIYPLIEATIVPYEGKYIDGKLEGEFCFILKNGKKVIRRRWVDIDSSISQLEKLYSITEYRIALLQLLDENFVDKIKIGNSAFEGVDMKTVTMEEDVTKEFLDIYRKEALATTIEDIRNSEIAGQFTLYGEFENTGMRAGYNMKNWVTYVYSCHSETLRFLEEKKLYSPKQINPDEIMQIIITRDGDYNDNIVNYSMSYDTREDVEELSKYIRPNIWYCPLLYRNLNYNISVWYNDGGISSFGFVNGKVPDMVLNDFK